MFRRISFLLGALAAVLLAASIASLSAQAAPKVWDLPAKGISGADQPAVQPSLYTGPDQTVYAVWSRRSGSFYQVEFSQKSSGGQFTAPVAISSENQSAYSPKVMASADGTVTVVWYAGGAVMASQREPGTSFGVPVRISPSNRTASNPSISEPSKNDGLIVIAWIETGGAGARVGASNWRADFGFSPPFLISKANQPAHGVRVVYDSAEEEHVAMWVSEVGGFKRVQTSIRIGGGAFQDPVSRSPADLNAADAEIAIDSRGTYLMVWRAQGPDGWAVQALHLGSGLPVTTLSEPGAATLTPTVTDFPTGGFVISWSEQVGTDKLIRLVDKPTDTPFGPAVTMSPAGLDAEEPRVLVAGDGTTFLTWLEETAVGNRVVGSIREPASGFGEPVALTDADVPAFTPVVAADVGNQVLAGWVRKSQVEVVSTIPVKTEIEPPHDGDEVPELPAAGLAYFDGKTLTFRLKCPARFKPACRGKARIMNGKGRRAVAMGKRVNAGQKAGAWKRVKIVVKPRFRALVAGFAKTPQKRTLIVRQRIGKKGKPGRKQSVVHRYRVRSVN